MPLGHEASRGFPLAIVVADQNAGILRLRNWFARREPLSPLRMTFVLFGLPNGSIAKSPDRSITWRALARRCQTAPALP